MAAPVLSIVVPTHGRSRSLVEVLRALEGQDGGLVDAEVIVVLDAAGADLPGLAKAAPSLRLSVLRAEDPGASAARNTGWRASRAPLTLFLDDDIIPRRRLVAEHLSWHRRSPEVELGVLGVVRWSPRVKVTPFMRWLESGIQFDYDRITTTEVGWQRFYSCNVSVKRAMLERVQGYDQERFPFGYEDLDLGLRMSRYGFRLLFNPAAVGEHLKTETLASWSTKLERIAIAERRFVERYPDARPYFYERFRAAAQAPPARGRSAWLTRYISPKMPLLGRRAWRSFGLICEQQLAPRYLASWDAVDGAVHSGEQ